MKTKTQKMTAKEKPLVYHEIVQDNTGKYDITFTSVKSSNIKGIGREHWGKVNERLWVHFLNGSIYYYYVPIGTYEKMMQAESAGKFLNQEIIPKYTDFKLRDVRK